MPFHLSRLPVRHGVPVTAHEWRKSVRENLVPHREREAPGASDLNNLLHSQSIR